MRTMLVAPGVPKGMPATMMMRSPTDEYPSRRANLQARKAMSSISLASFVRIECTPHTRARRRAVLTLGVSAMTVEFGRSRAMRNAVEPEKVQAATVLMLSVSVIWWEAAAMASDPVASGAAFRVRMIDQ